MPAAVAGAFVNLEPLVGALTGAVVFHDAVGPAQLAGGAAILVGIMLGLPAGSGGRSRKNPPVGPPSGSVAVATDRALRETRPAHGRASPEAHSRPTTS